MKRLRNFIGKKQCSNRHSSKFASFFSVRFCNHRILSRKQASVSETRAQPPMGKFIQLSDGVFTRWKNCMTALSLESDSEMAEFLLNR